jgi:hypothetical protein
MRHFIGSLVSILIVLGEGLAAQQPNATAADEAQPASIRINHDVLVENQRLEYIFLDLLRGTGVHGGFVEVAGCSDLPEGHLDVKQGVTVGEAMDALVAANPSYQWEVKDGVVNLMPLGGVPLLSTRIAKFQMNTTDRDIGVALQEVLKLPEARESRTALGLKDGIHHGFAEAVEEHPMPLQPVPVLINVQDVSLREAFNKIVQASPNRVWVYRETDCGGAKTFTVEAASDY